MNDWRCAVCLKSQDSHASRNNAAPFMIGHVCCDNCNWNIIIPYKSHLIRKGMEGDKIEDCECMHCFLNLGKMLCYCGEEE
tara:strand:- start:129 stop:371 length:243 start_codon:yes stop_codon:yes gene_type:complete